MPIQARIAKKLLQVIVWVTLTNYTTFLTYAK